MNTVMVTGGLGFAGRHIIERLAGSSTCRLRAAGILGVVLMGQSSG